MIFRSLLFLAICLLTPLYLIATDTTLSSYFPIAEGLKWNYKVNEEGKTFNQEVVCKKPYLKGDNDCDFVLETKSIRKTRYHYKIEHNFIYLLKIDVLWNRFPVPLTFVFTPAMPVFSLSPFATNTQKWSWKGSITSLLYKRTYNAAFTMTDDEILKTALGNSKCVKVTVVQSDKHDIERIDSWYAQDIGLVSIYSAKHDKSITKLLKRGKN